MSAAALAGIGLAAGAASSIAGAAMQSNAASSGAKKAQQGINWGWQQSQPFYQQAVDWNAPYYQAGTDALWRLQNLLGFKGGVDSASGTWLQDLTPQAAAAAAGINYDRLITPIRATDIQSLMGKTPQQAYAPIKTSDVYDYTGLRPKQVFQGVSPSQIEKLAGVSLKGLTGMADNIPLEINPNLGAYNSGKRTAQGKSREKVHANRDDHISNLQNAGIKGAMSPAQQMKLAKLMGW